MDLGVISQKIKMIKVVATAEISMTISSSFDFNNRVKRTVDIVAAAVLAKLLPIKIVEKNSSGFLSIFFNRTAFFFFFLALRLSLIMLTDNNAVSAVEKKALKIINIINKIIYRTISIGTPL
jgi:hypothetical protein